MYSQHMPMRATIAMGIAMMAASAGLGGVAQEKAATHAHEESSTNNGCYQRLADAMVRMHQAMAAVKPSSPSNTDADFVRMMLPHHQAAVEMAKVELECGGDRQMKRMAQEIVTDQQSEIELMELWLKRHAEK
jgi:uncharacterized protein (DUF305 family)